MELKGKKELLLEKFVNVNVNKSYSETCCNLRCFIAHCTCICNLHQGGHCWTLDIAQGLEVAPEGMMAGSVGTDAARHQGLLSHPADHSVDHSILRLLLWLGLLWLGLGLGVLLYPESVNIGKNMQNFKIINATFPLTFLKQNALVKIHYLYPCTRSRPRSRLLWFSTFLCLHLL